MLFDVSVEEFRLRISYVHLVVQLCRDCGHHADALEPAHGSEGATAADTRDLRNSLHNESKFIVSTLILNTHLVPIPSCPAVTERNDTSSKTPCFSRVAIFLSDAAFQRAIWGRSITSKVFGIRYDFSSNRLGIKLMRSIRRVRVGVEI